MEKFCIQKHTLLVIIRYPLFMIGTPGQCIRLVLYAWFVDDDELESRKEKGPSGLSSGKFLLRPKINQIHMVGPDLGGITTSLEVVSECMKGMDDCE